MQLKKHFDFLCNKIGSRVFGSEEEKKAAEYIRKNFEKNGLKTSVQKFPVERKIFKEYQFKKIKNGKEIKIECLPFGFSSFTPKEGLYLPIEYLENISYECIKKKNLKGKCVLLFEGFGENYIDFKNFLNLGVSGVILIDKRYPVNWPIFLNMPYFWKDYGKIPPVVSIPYFEGFKLKKENIKKVFLKIIGKEEVSESENVIGIIEGKSEENVIITSHHDSVLSGKGADDNASGVVMLLELAKHFSRKKPERNLIFISFGAEEVLSYGSFQFVKSNPGILKNTVIVINFDAFASFFGESIIRITGDNSLKKFIKEIVKNSPIYFKVEKLVSPYSDHYPFNLFKIPSLYTGRINCKGGFFHYHSDLDNMEIIDFKILAETIEIFKRIVEEISFKKKLPFLRLIPISQIKEIEKYSINLGIKNVLLSEKVK